MAKKTVKVTVGETVKEYPGGSTFEAVANDFQENYDARIVLVHAGSKLRELNKKINDDCEVSFKTVKDRSGYKTYRRTATFIMIKAIRDIAGVEALKKIKVEFAIGKGIYVSITGGVKVDRDFLCRVKNRMDEIVNADIPIIKESYDL
ncbi:MAG: nucleoside kinase, partial [Lachnospiraceae bacterium]|nr:nucleoside kinase [Lachnospiraceae bacterium]